MKFLAKLFSFMAVIGLSFAFTACNGGNTSSSSSDSSVTSSVEESTAESVESVENSSMEESTAESVENVESVENSSVEESTAESVENSSATAPATEYTIYVVDTDGNPIQGVRIGICSYDETTEQKGNCLMPIATDADGKVVFTDAEGVYIVNDEIFEEDYEAQEKCVLKAYGEYTLVLTAI